MRLPIGNSVALRIRNYAFTRSQGEPLCPPLVETLPIFSYTPMPLRLWVEFGHGQVFVNDVGEAMQESFT